MEEKMELIKEMKELLDSQDIEIQTLKRLRDMDNIEINELKEREKDLERTIDLKNIELAETKCEVAEIKSKLAEITSKVEIIEDKAIVNEVLWDKVVILDADVSALWVEIK